jgi:hypothetical protein
MAGMQSRRSNSPTSEAANPIRHRFPWPKGGFACLLLAGWLVQAGAACGELVTIAVNFNINLTTAVDDTAGGGFYWSAFGDAGASPTVFRPLASALDGSATAFEMSATDNARISSTQNSSSKLITLDGVRLPAAVTNRGLGGRDGNVGDALTAWRVRVPTASIALAEWNLQMFIGDNRGGGLSPGAANVGGTFSFSAGTGSFSGGTTAFFGDPAGNPTNSGVDFVRTATMTVTPVQLTIDGVDYYVLDLQLGDLGRADSGTADYTSMVGMVITVVPEPSTALLVLGTLAVLLARAAVTRRERTMWPTSGVGRLAG